MENSFPQLPDLQILRCIGSGATSHVYEAFSNKKQNKVAVKVVPIQSILGMAMNTRVEREASTLQTLQHPNIVRLYEFYRTDQNLIFELEYIDGCTLTEWSKRNSNQLLEPKLLLLSLLTQAIAVAHNNQTIHRDIKPENILISNDGDLKLTDFGLAKQMNRLDCTITHPGMIIGSLAYMAPEALVEGQFSYSSDIFSFGVVAYELLAGQHPFPHKDVKTLLDSIYSNKTSSRSLSRLNPRLEALLLRCIDVDPEKRPTSLWTIYAEIMAMLDVSDIRDLCKDLICHSESTNSALMQALKIKHEMLREKIDSELVAKDRNKKVLLHLVKEFSILFPNDKNITKYLSLLRDKTSVGRRAKYVVFTIITLALLFFARDYRSGAVQPKPQQLEQSEPDLMPQSQPEPQTQTEPEPIPQSQVPTTPVSKSIVAMGTLQVIVPASARVYVDETMYTASELRGLRLSVGSHILRIERRGYLPIQSAIRIKKNKVTKINTSESSDEE